MAPPDMNTIAPRILRTPSASQTNPSSLQASPGQSRRTSSVMGPPPVPNNSSLPNSPRPSNAAMADASAGSNGPIRHPRPLTAAELHLELEKEQESIVNRLTRELSALRAQTASVASTASSTSDLFSSTHNLPEHPYPSSYQGTGASIIPTSARRHRSSSNLSTRSARSAREGVSNATTSVSGVAAPRDRDTNTSHGTSARQSLDISRPETSRQGSYNLGYTNSNNGVLHGSSYRSTSATSPYTHNAPFGHAQRPSLGSASHSYSHSRDTSQGVLPTPSQNNQGQGNAGEARSPSFGSAQAAARYEEAAIQRQELEAVKRENEALKQRIKDLEKAVASQGSASATAGT